MTWTQPSLWDQVPTRCQETGLLLPDSGFRTHLDAASVYFFTGIIELPGVGMGLCY